MKEVVKSDQAPAALGPYSQAIKVRGSTVVYCSGQIGLDPQTGSLVGETAAEQGRRVMENLKAVIEAAGAHLTSGGGLEFVESTVTELAGPGLRIETRLPVQVDERIMVLVQLTQGRDGAAARHTLAAVGRVRHSQSIERRTGIPDAIDRVWNGAPQRETAVLAAQPLLIGVELIGLNDEEIDTLVSLTGELSSLVPDHDVNRARGPQEAPTYTTAS